MGCTDSNSDALYYEYDPEKGFDYREFLDKIIPLLPDYFLQDGKLTPDTDGMVMSVEYTDYTEELEAMFARIGVKALDGGKKFVWYKPLD